MSWDVRLCDSDGKTVSVPVHSDGGTYAEGGVPYAELNVTYNYGKRFREAAPEYAEGSGVLVRMLDGKRASETKALLARMVGELGTETSDDYWEDTAGNAGYALARLLEWALLHPDAVWEVS